MRQWFKFMEFIEVAVLVAIFVSKTGAKKRQFYCNVFITSLRGQWPIAIPLNELILTSPSANAAMEQGMRFWYLAIKNNSSAVNWNFIQVDPVYIEEMNRIWKQNRLFH